MILFDSEHIISTVGVVTATRFHHYLPVFPILIITSYCGSITFQRNQRLPSPGQNGRQQPTPHIYSTGSCDSVKLLCFDWWIWKYMQTNEDNQLSTRRLHCFWNISTHICHNEASAQFIIKALVSRSNLSGLSCLQWNLYSMGVCVLLLVITLYHHLATIPALHLRKWRSSIKIW